MADLATIAGAARDHSLQLPQALIEVYLSIFNHNWKQLEAIRYELVHAFSILLYVTQELMTTLIKYLIYTKQGVVQLRHASIAQLGERTTEDRAVMCSTRTVILLKDSTVRKRSTFEA